MIEYFSYLNLWLIILFLFLCLFFLIFSSCQLLICSLYCSGAVFEFSLILVSFLFILIIISPALIILLDYEIIIVPSFIVFVCGYQWAWTFSGSLFSSFFSFTPPYSTPLIGSSSFNTAFFSLDHYLLSSFYFRCVLFNWFFKFCWFNEHCFELLIALNSSLLSKFFFYWLPQIALLYSLSSSFLYIELVFIGIF